MSGQTPARADINKHRSLAQQRYLTSLPPEVVEQFINTPKYSHTVSQMLQYNATTNGRLSAGGRSAAYSSAQLRLGLERTDCCRCCAPLRSAECSAAGPMWQSADRHFASAAEVGDLRGCLFLTSCRVVPFSRAPSPNRLHQMFQWTGRKAARNEPRF